MQSSGLDHVNLSVSDLKRSRRFYADVLGFEVFDYPRDYANSLFAGAFSFMVGGVEIVFMQHPETPPGDRFSEFRIGLDHLAFKAPDEAALQGLVDRLLEAGVTTQGVEIYQPSGKKSVTFRDPDDIQLEYWLDQPAQ